MGHSRKPIHRGFQFFDRVEVFILPTKSFAFAGGREYVHSFLVELGDQPFFKSNSFRQIMSSDFGP